MLKFKSYLSEKSKPEEYKNVFIGKIYHDIEDEGSVADRMKSLAEAFLAGEKRHQGRSETEIKALHTKLAKRYRFGKKLKRKQQPELDDPQGDTKLAFRKYVGVSYRKINKALYAGQAEGLDEEHKSIVSHLKAAMTAYKTPEDMTVSSGIKFDPRSHQKDADGPIKIKNDAFTSTSLSKPAAEDFIRDLDTPEGGRDRHMIHIDVPKGSHGVYIGHHSSLPHEREFILHPGARLHVDPVPQHVHEYQNWRNKTTRTFHWNARLVHDGVRNV
jgi:hypothetical protein